LFFKYIIVDSMCNNIDTPNNEMDLKGQKHEANASSALYYMQ